MIRDKMIENGLSRHELARSFVRGAHDLEMTSLPCEKEAAAIFMRDKADHLLTGRSWFLFKGELEVPFPIDAAERARCSIATDRGTCEEVAMDLALQLMRVGWPPKTILGAFLAVGGQLTCLEA
ncbi:hypothetical protein [Fulvimarina sp. MAC3]|uniref:hypothetical protein n=1 Tax=Fulvimarina sp. MAC3 TaxID=3148887 RepID=UPI0031FCC799